MSFAISLRVTVGRTAVPRRLTSGDQAPTNKLERVIHLTAACVLYSQLASMASTPVFVRTYIRMSPQESIQEHVEAVARLQASTERASLVINYLPRCNVDVTLDGSAEAIDCSNYTELERTQEWLGRKIDVALHHITFEHPAVRSALQLKLSLQSALRAAKDQIEARRRRVHVHVHGRADCRRGPVN
jgi:hypothetical protein